MKSVTIDSIMLELSVLNLVVDTFTQIKQVVFYHFYYFLSQFVLFKSYIFYFEFPLIAIMYQCIDS